MAEPEAIDMPRKPLFRRKRVVIPLALVFLAAGYLVWDFYPPRTVRFRGDSLAGMPIRRAEGLVVQGRSPDGRLWATRGMWAYKLTDDGDEFVRQYRIPTGANLYWLANFSLVRRLTGIEECVELLPQEGGAATAISAGWIWHRPDADRGFQRVHELRYYGRGVGRGAMPAGFTALGDGGVVLGEYFSNPDYEDVRVYFSPDGGGTWRIAHEFPPGRIRHVHAVQEDPYTGRVWVCTGDRDDESFIISMNPDGTDKTVIGHGAQRWRVVQLAFTEEAVYWGADTGCREDGGIWRWDRASEELEQLSTNNGPIYYATILGDETLVFSQTFERDGQRPPGLWILPAGGREPVMLPMAADRVRRNPRRHATPRLSRSPEKDFVHVSCLNIAGFASDLLRIPLFELEKFLDESR